MATDIEHKELPGSEIHHPYRWRVADEATRLALTPAASDVDKRLLQRSDNTEWRLVSEAPVTWARCDAKAAAEASTHAARTDNPHGTTAAQVGAPTTAQFNQEVTDRQAGDTAARAYADSLVVGLWDDRGSYDASGNTYPATGGSGASGAVLKGDIWTVSVAGTLGGVAVTAGDVVRALVNAPGQTATNWAVSEANLGYQPVKTVGGKSGPDVPFQTAAETSLTPTGNVAATNVQAAITELDTEKLATGATAANSERIGGYLPSQSAGPNQVPVIDPNGNLGVNTTPSPWNPALDVVDIGAYCSLYSSVGTDTGMLQNAYYDNGGVFRYKQNGYASYYNQNYNGNTGAHVWFTAPFGTAGSPITFTQAMELTQGGNLRIGIYNLPFGGNPRLLAATSDPAGSALAGILPNNTTGVALSSQSVTPASQNWYHFVGQSGDGSVITRNDILIFGNGNVQNANNSYGATSDAKLKTAVADAPSFWDRFKRVRFITYRLLADPSNKKLMGVLAQELRDIFPGLVTETRDTRSVIRTREVARVVPVMREEQIERTVTSIELVDGKWVRKVAVVPETIQVPDHDEYVVYDEDGTPARDLVMPARPAVIDGDGLEIAPATEAVYRAVTHRVAKMQTITETETYTEIEETGEVTLSVSYSVLGLIADAVTQELQARVEALEATVREGIA